MSAKLARLEIVELVDEIDAIFSLSVQLDIQPFTSGCSARVDRIVQLARCPVLVVK
jgi:hypothetical protein